MHAIRGSDPVIRVAPQIMFFRLLWPISASVSLLAFIVASRAFELVPLTMLTGIWTLRSAFAGLNERIELGDDYIVCYRGAFLTTTTYLNLREFQLHIDSSLFTDALNMGKVTIERSNGKHIVYPGMTPISRLNDWYRRARIRYCL